MSDDDAPGWDAIERAFAALYPGDEPRHYGLAPGVAFGSPLQGISAYHGDGVWHLVTFGLTELFAKESLDPDVSGFGYELTMLVPRGVEPEPPRWALDALARTASTAREVGQPTLPGDRIDAGGPITGGDPPTRLTALAATTDRVAPATHSPHGRVAFHQLVGVTADELAEMKATSTEAVLERLAAADARLVTRVDR